MEPAHFGALAVLALVDSTSFGTLLIPVWLLLAPGRLRPGRILLFLATVAVFYFAAGLAILFGAGFVVENYGTSFQSRGFSVLLLVAGAALLVTDSFHGATFAAILNTPCVIQRRYREDDPERKNSRIDQLLRHLDVSDLEQPEWQKVNERLTDQAERGKKWLLDRISQAAL